MSTSSEFRVYMQHRNRADLLTAAVASIPEFHDVLTIVDNSENGFPGNWHKGCYYTPSVPLTFSQTHNWFFQDAMANNCSFLIWMHSDAESTNKAHLKLLEFTRAVIASGRKWHTIWTNYDAIAAVNLASIADVGGYDPCIRKYLADNDLHRRMRLCGWECIDSGIDTLHHGSSTIKSDPQLQFTNDIVHGLDAQYFRRKWGGDPGKERFTVPFNRPDLFPTMKPVGVW